MPLITLANAKKFECSTDQNMLDAARQQDIVLEHSCRTGRCGVCKAKVLTGMTTIQQAEEALTVEELAENYILTCCRSAISDTFLDIEDLGELGKLKVKTLPCRIDSLQQLSSDVIEVKLRTPPASRLEYLPGQYVDVIGKDGLRRSYSVANAPREDGIVSLQIRKVEAGQMSHYWFEEAKPNDLLRMEGPLGTFSLRPTKQKELVLLATGTGIAPIKAILEQLAADQVQNSFSSIHLYWGGRAEGDIYWLPHYPDLPLRYTPVLSRGSEDWKGRTGYVQHAVLEDAVALETAIVFACGSETMIHSAQAELTTAGLNAAHFYSDAFVSSN